MQEDLGTGIFIFNQSCSNIYLFFLLDTTFKAYSIHIPDNLGLAALFISFGAENTYAYFTHSR